MHPNEITYAILALAGLLPLEYFEGITPGKLFVASEILLCELPPTIISILNPELEYILNIQSQPAAGSSAASVFLCSIGARKY